MASHSKRSRPGPHFGSPHHNNALTVVSNTQPFDRSSPLRLLFLHNHHLAACYKEGLARDSTREAGSPPWPRTPYPCLPTPLKTSPGVRTGVLPDLIWNLCSTDSWQTPGRQPLYRWGLVMLLLYGRGRGGVPGDCQVGAHLLLAVLEHGLIGLQDNTIEFRQRERGGEGAMTWDVYTNKSFMSSQLWIHHQ